MYILSNFPIVHNKLHANKMKVHGESNTELYETHLCDQNNTSHGKISK